MPSRSTSSANFSGVHLNESFVGYPASNPATANIFSPMQNNRSLPHCTRSVTCGNERQYLRTCSRSMLVPRTWCLVLCTLFETKHKAQSSKLKAERTKSKEQSSKNKVQ